MCPVCKSWQSRWKNNLVFFGGSAGVLALLFTAATYVSTTIYTALSQRQDAQVLQFQYPGHQIVDNSGTVPLMLSHYEFVWHSGKKATHERCCYHWRKSFRHAEFLAIKTTQRCLKTA